MVNIWFCQLLTLNYRVHFLHCINTNRKERYLSFVGQLYVSSCICLVSVQVKMECPLGLLLLAQPVPSTGAVHLSPSASLAESIWYHPTTLKTLIPYKPCRAAITKHHRVSAWWLVNNTNSFLTDPEAEKLKMKSSVDSVSFSGC